MSAKIKTIKAEEILDSRGNPTLKVLAYSENGYGAFAVPSGASTGSHEAQELRDGDPNYSRGLGVNKAIEKIDKIISPALLGIDVCDQKKIDSILLKLDGTDNKSTLGGNSVIGASIACAKAAANEEKVQLFEYLRGLENVLPSSSPTPLLFINLINGGKHARTQLAFQEYLLIPQTDNVTEALQIGAKIQQTLRDLVVGEFGSKTATMGDEGGLALHIESVKKPLELLMEALNKTENLARARLGLDVAASSFYSNGIYSVEGKNFTSEMLFDLHSKIIKDFNIFSVEDPFFEEDFGNFHKLLSKNPGLTVVGDDLTVTNSSRLYAAIKQKSINAVIIKPNQIGTVTETLGTMKLARENGIECIVSHRSGETMDDFIADLAFAFHCFGLKAGALGKPERDVKYNRLARISNLANKSTTA